jgi:hypothetical protein
VACSRNIPAGIAVAISQRVTVRTSQGGSQNNGRRDGDVRGDVMQGFIRVARNLVPGVLAICLVSVGAPCAAQEVDPPGANVGSGVGSGSVFAPSPWINVIAPVQDRIDLKLYGFYIGDLDVPAAQVDVPVRTTKFLTITPSYLYYSVPARGLDDLANLSGAFTDSYDEHQFRIDGTVTFSIRKLEISGRNMYVRRFRPAPADDSNRYRGRIGIAHPLAVKGRIWKPFASYETYYDHHNGGWNKDRVWTGVTLPLQKHIFLQPSYLWERSDGLKTINYVLFGLIVNTR